MPETDTRVADSGQSRYTKHPKTADQNDEDTKAGESRKRNRRRKPHNSKQADKPSNIQQLVSNRKRQSCNLTELSTKSHRSPLINHKESPPHRYGLRKDRRRHDSVEDDCLPERGDNAHGQSVSKTERRVRLRRNKESTDSDQERRFHKPVRDPQLKERRELCAKSEWQQSDIREPVEDEQINRGMDTSLLQNINTNRNICGYVPYIHEGAGMPFSFSKSVVNIRCNRGWTSDLHSIGFINFMGNLLTLLTFVFILFAIAEYAFCPTAIETLKPGQETNKGPSKLYFFCTNCGHECEEPPPPPETSSSNSTEEPPPPSETSSSKSTEGHPKCHDAGNRNWFAYLLFDGFC